MPTIFQRNVNALKEKNPVLAAQLSLITPNANFEVYRQGNDEINLNIIDKKNKYPIYEKDFFTYLEQKQKEFKKYERYPVLFLFGMGNGIFTKLLFGNEVHKKVIVYEPNLEILFIAFNIVDFSNEILNDKILFFIPSLYNYPTALNIFEHPDVITYNKVYQLHIHSPYYEKFYAEEIMKINKINLRAIKQSVVNLGNDVIDTLVGLEHHIKNLPETIKNIPFKKFVNKNKNISDTAVIVSTGPSLQKQLPLLKKIQDYATIISVDASMPILAKHGIKPDYVTSLERVEATAKFFENTPKSFQKDVVMLHASLQHEKVLKNSHGIKCLPIRPFRITRFIGNNNYGYLGIGMSAANMAYEFAYLSGYKKIVLIGQDLAYANDGKSHASGHVYGEDEVKFQETDEFVTAYGGEGKVRTTRVWNMFRNFFEKDIAHTSKEGVVTINATEGGARIEGAIEKPFKEIVEEILKEKKKKRKIKLIYPSDKEIDRELQKAYKKLQEILTYGEKLQKRIEKTFLKVAKECEKLEKLNEEKKLEEIDYDYLIKLSNEIDKIKTKLETKKFYRMFGETIQSELIHQEMELAKIQVAPSDTEIEKKAKLIDWIMKHKYWLFSIAGTINAQRIVITRSLPTLEKELKKRNLLKAS
jgi:hypothetical protein